MNRNIFKSTRSMLYEVYLSQNLQAEAVATAVYLRNRSPNVSHLKVFGCKAMVHIPKSKQNGKLKQQSAKCVFVGYPNDSKGYKFYNRVEKKMLRSNDVIFFENEKYFDVHATHSVFLDIYTESSETDFVKMSIKLMLKPTMASMSYQQNFNLVKANRI